MRARNGYFEPMGASTLSADMTDAREPAPDRPRGPAVVIAGASAGGVEALVALVSSLPADFPHAMLIVLHVSPTGTSVLPAILARACPLPVCAPADGEELRAGPRLRRPAGLPPRRRGIARAPEPGPARERAPPGDRPDDAHGGERLRPATIGIVLSGSRDDGTAGLMAIKASGGIAIVQDPEEALYPAMPLSAMAHVEPDAVLPIAAMARWILGHDPQTNRAPMSSNSPTQPHHPGQPHRSDRRRRIWRSSTPKTTRRASATGEGTRYTCPDCGGVLFERREGLLERFECSVGHVFSIESLSSAQADALENALWAAVRSLEDRAALLMRLAVGGRERRQLRSAVAFERHAREALERARTIRADHPELLGRPRDRG